MNLQAREPARLQKRSWSPYFKKNSDKWHTGTDCGYFGGDPQDGKLHEVRKLTLTPKEMSYNSHMVFVDNDGDTFLMTATDGLELIKDFIAGKVAFDPTGKYMITDFVQVKRGSKLFIKVYNEN